MEITKNLYNKELRKYYFPLKWFAFLMTKNWGIKLLHRFTSTLKGKNIQGVHCEERYIPSRSNGPDIRIRIFRPEKVNKPLPALLYIHGGGYMIGVPELALNVIENYIKTRPCVVIAPDYRKSVQHPFPAGFNDCYDTLLWMKENRELLNTTKFMIAGHSAGGGLTAAVTLKARDTKEVEIAFQMPCYPMIDHLQNTESAKSLNDAPAWNSKTNAKAWELYLRNTIQHVPIYASPSLNQDYKNLPPTISFVGELEPFRDECLHFIEQLKKENIPVRFAVFEGAFHGFETVATAANISIQANRFQFDAFAEFYDKYVTVKD